MENTRNYSEDEFGIFIISELTELKDIELTILKGHILTEFAINCYLESISENKNSDFFKENFTYSSKVKLLLHFGNYSGPGGEYVIKSLEILNKLRNTIAHSLTINHHLIKEFLAMLRKISPSRGNFNNEKLSEQHRLESGIAFVCGMIFGRYCEIRKKNS
ncbi:hypothetical protein [Psychroserpens luteus]|uniref:Mannitol repressor n=1 Tax=Psychroserpens luteus TaxID=1434066 RepID=A0ABW5ZPZ4_9FLAO|nr:hypothetical protein [Psychroserpens luteus]